MSAGDDVVNQDEEDEARQEARATANKEALAAFRIDACLVLSTLVTVVA